MWHASDTRRHNTIVVAECCPFLFAAIDSLKFSLVAGA